MKIPVAEAQTQERCSKSANCYLALYRYITPAVGTATNTQSEKTYSKPLQTFEHGCLQPTSPEAVPALYRVRSATTCRVIQAARSHHKQSYRKHGSLLILLSRLRHVHHCWWHAARCKWQRMLTCAATAWHRSRPTNPRRHRCDCRAIRPTTGVAAPSGSIYRSAPAVKAHERGWAAMSRA